MPSPLVVAAARSRPEQALVWSLLAVLALLVLKCAWVCDDAYITLRVVDNFVSGHGPRWNVAERVQAYTHPLWMLLLSGAYAISGEAFFTSIAMGVATSLAAAVVLARGAAKDAAGAALALAVLACSKAFVDFSTSGLENPLLHLALLGALMWAPRGRSLAVFGLCTAAVALTRPDGVVLLTPLVVWRLYSERSARAVGAFALGATPLVLWELFSLVYYGALIPNTAIAKLETGLGAGELAAQGLAYLVDSATRDPLTLLAITAALVIAALRRVELGLPIALGLALHLAYVVKIGGDFMSGRFLTAPLFVAAFVFARAELAPRVVALLALAALALAGLSPLSPLRAPLDYARGKPPAEHVADTGIADERGYWFAAAGLFTPQRALPAPPYRHVSRGHGLAFRLRDEGAPAQIVEGIGYLGYWAGPSVHLVDPMGLSDAFIARLPIVVDGEIVRPEKNRFREKAWRVGHYYRDVPAGYVERLRGEPHAFEDLQLEELFQNVRLITRGELASPQRWRAIARLLL